MAARDSVDLLVIGGGINGAGIARDAAGRGLDVALVEQSDLASGTSSASTKLIHGGLRYLEQFELRLVRESLSERERLLAIAPHIVTPLRFVVPHLEGLRPRWQIRLGLFVYDHLGGSGRLPGSHGVRIAGTNRGAGLKTDIRYGFEYSDCRVDDSRLVVLNALDASLRGAAVHTRTQLVSAAARDGRWRALCRNRISGEQFTIESRALVNAAGPWVEDVLKRIHTRIDERRAVLVKGSHIVVPRLFPGAHAFLLQHRDGRVVFAIPYEREFTLVGTTDFPYQGDPAAVRISAEEIGYLCGAVNEYFERSVEPSDVKWAYAGVRALSVEEANDHAANLSKVTRDYTLELTRPTGEPPALSIFGGKLTTYRKLAEAALEKLHPFIGGSTRSWTAGAPLPGGDLPGAGLNALLHSVRHRWPFLPPAWAERLACTYGTRIDTLLGGARAIEELGERYGADLTRAEVDYLRRYEWAMTAEDILWRRTKLGLHMAANECSRLEQAVAAPDLKTG